CIFDSTTVTGPVQVLSIPATNGFVLVDNTNTVVVYGAGQAEVSEKLLWKWDGTQYTNNGFAITRSGGGWTLDSDLGDHYYVSANGNVTNDSWNRSRRKLPGSHSS